MNESKKTRFTKVKGGINAKNRNSGITLIALVVTIIVNRVFYDKNKKYSNLVGSPMIYINL